nr:methyltransferase domain-containing protein [uncultured Acetatifactor sp.]
MDSEKKFQEICKCPLCDSNKKAFMYMSRGGGGDDRLDEFAEEVSVVRCEECGLIYSESVLTESEKKDFFSLYSSKVHEDSKETTGKRQTMYQLEFEYIAKYLDFSKSVKVLDVGCAEGKFLDFFSQEGLECYGVEVGMEAANIAESKYKVYKGNLPELEINEKFDLIILRGVMQYFENPKDYFWKIDTLLNKSGLIYITSQPNMDSICHQLFKDKFILPVCAIARNGFSKDVLVRYWGSKKYCLVGEKYFYEETPYADVHNDIEKVYRAAELKKQGKTVDFRSPAFWGNMMTLVFKK